MINELRAQMSVTANWRGRVARGLVATTAAITALGRFPGYVPNMVHGEPGTWLALGDGLFEWVGIAGVFLASVWTSDTTPRATTPDEP